MKNITDLIARVLISAIFIYEAADSVMFFQETKAKMSAFNILWQQDILLVMSIVLLIIGGVLILLGYRMGFGGFLVLAYWVPVTFIAHSFWNYPVPEMRIEALIFVKNLAITGGVLLLMINASGRFSVKRLMPVTRIPKGET
jgi:putative oxidoreductase